MEQDQDEVLEVGKASGRGRRRAGWILVLVVLTLIVLHASTGGSDRQAVPNPTPSDLISTVPDGRTARAWPTASGACGADTLLPIVSSAPPAEHTGIQVLLGGDRLRLVDFDNGHATTLPDAVVRPGEYAAVLASDPITAYATTGSCDETAPYAMLRISVDHRVSVIRPLGPTESPLTDGNRVWIASFASSIDNPFATIAPVAGGPQVRLPHGFYASAIVGDTVVGQLQPDPGISPTWLALVDARTGRLQAKLEQRVAPLAVGAGQVLWTSGCGDDAALCTLHRRAIAGGQTVGSPLPRLACCGVVSPDGTRVAFLIERATTDSRFDGHPLPPMDIAIMRLDTGRLAIVPGIELPTKTQPGLAFAARGDWLVVALNAGSRTRLLAWRPGLRQPYETTALPGPVHDPPTLVVTSR
ncbi:hypothetical protein E0H73_13350 [Kribbella pittospori]|uniref:WD40 repeat domain-containing protein n=1 Tax=Kribbella pittospori TaxID=722689 RepID=A0A4R0KR85_9ACTN|nr:hypothetical protein [Kribbella pittospori]TCC63423.1 hypothetical protein E0H73_13350 [Kribbella pittospori]